MRLLSNTSAFTPHCEPTHEKRRMNLEDVRRSRLLNIVLDDPYASDYALSNIDLGRESRSTPSSSSAYGLQLCKRAQPTIFVSDKPEKLHAYFIQSICLWFTHVTDPRSAYHRRTVNAAWPLLKLLLDVSKCPLKAASISGIHPSLSAASTLAALSKSSSIMIEWPF